jgi:hypothetical protein
MKIRSTGSVIDATYLLDMGYSQFTVKYFDCKQHQGKFCVCGGNANKYWTIDGVPINKFVKDLENVHVFISYIFIDHDNICRKIGEGRVDRIKANLKAHYHHGPTKSSRTKLDRLNGNLIASECRNNPLCKLFIMGFKEKSLAKDQESVIKDKHKGWLDYDQSIFITLN